MARRRSATGRGIWFKILVLIVADTISPEKSAVQVVFASIALLDTTSGKSVLLWRQEMRRSTSKRPPSQDTKTPSAFTYCDDEPCQCLIPRHIPPELCLPRARFYILYLVQEAMLYSFMSSTTFNSVRERFYTKTVHFD